MSDMDRYRHLLLQLWALRAEGVSEAAEDDILEEMDLCWDRMLPEERVSLEQWLTTLPRAPESLGMVDRELSIGDSGLPRTAAP